MNIPDCITLDWETFPIDTRPSYPPMPVGLATKWPGSEPIYRAFGHPTGNNATEQDVGEELERIWKSGLPVLCHHAKFDLAVCYERFGAPALPWERVHDTMYLAYLCDPHCRDLGLKDLAEDFLAWPPEEQDAMATWIMNHDQTLLAAYPWNREEGKPNPRHITISKIGRWIFATPGHIAGPYAAGDCSRTEALFRHFWPLVQDNGMGGSYDRERRLMPILLENEREGMRVDMEHLHADIADFGGSFAAAETWLRRELKASGLNFDSDDDVSAILSQRGIVPDENWQTTDSGKLSMSKENLLPEHFTGPNGAQIASVLGYRNRLKTCLTMFMAPWLKQAEQYGGRITTNWNQVMGERGGTRTGRPSTNKHNFLNISKKWDGRDDGYIHPDFIAVRPLPLVRTYVLPDEGEEFLHRDFSGQEMRIFADGEQGALYQQYADNPALDPHEFVGAELMRVARREIERTKVKTLNFQGLYGGGVPALQRKLRVSFAEAKELKKFHDAALPGRVLFNEEIKRIVGRGDPIRTIGGRLYYPEPPGKDGRSKVYKLINYWVQGGAADLTKEVLIQWHSHPKRTARFMVTVYDEINACAPVGPCAVEQMALLKGGMETPHLGMSVPMLSDPKHGKSWGHSKRCKPEEGCLLCQ